MTGTFQERVHAFGPDDAMTGVVTLPDDPASADRPFVVLLNAGLVHRVGPFGMGVQLARGLAARGFRVLRFDQSGLGDSPPRHGDAPIEAQVLADGRAAMDSLAERHGARRFVVGGLCSGALNAHRLALADARVAAFWMLDGYAYPTNLYYKHLFVRRVKTPKTWGQLGRRIVAHGKKRVGNLLGVPPPAPGPIVEHGDGRHAIFYQDWPAIPDARRDLEQMLARGVRILCVYTGGWSSFVDPKQFDEMFPRLAHRDRVTVAYYPYADHSYLALEDRAVMVRDVGAFVASLPPAP